MNPTRSIFAPTRGGSTLLRRWLWLLPFWLLGVLSSLGAEVLWQEDFESPDVWDRWGVVGGVWNIGAPTSGPNNAHPPSQRCAATVLGGNYPSSADCRLVKMDPFDVPDASLYPRLRFWHWWSFAAGDYGTVEVRLGGGAWQPLAPAYLFTSSAWTRCTLDLRNFANQRIELAFHFKSNTDANVAPGWYLDDVELVTGRPEWNNPEYFSAGLGDWNVERGDWEVGVPTGGPGRAYSGTTCAGTVLAGNYDARIDTRLISPEFEVPTGYPRLRFWHWWNFAPNDRGIVEIRVEGGAWQPLSAVDTLNRSLVWTRTTFDLGPYVGKTVEIAFHFLANAQANPGPGWYIDNVEIVTSEPVFENPEPFTSLGDWNVLGGDWEVGVPKGGPGKGAPPSTNTAAGTVLSVPGGRYDPSVDTRLISPAFTVPLVNNPRLRFWHWWNMSAADAAVVEIREAGGAWQTDSLIYTNSSLAWTSPKIDLRRFAGKAVEVAFHFKANSDANVGSGWYVDHVELRTNDVDFDIITRPETFESGLGEWEVDRGDWEVGVPTAGPGKAEPPGTRCAGTVLGGNYGAYLNSRLISPEFVLPDASEHPRLRFSYWHSNGGTTGDVGAVLLREPGGAWHTLASYYRYNRAWTSTTLDLAEYAGKSVQIAFQFSANNDGVVDAGWYIDNVQVVTGETPYLLTNQPEGFENGQGEWIVDGGNWQIGRPGPPGPSTAYKGTNCAGTVLTGNYDPYVNSRLISPVFFVPCVEAAPKFRFAHWYNFAAGDSGVLEVREVGGSWSTLTTFTGSNPEWGPGLFFDLSSYAGKAIQVAFRLSANTDANVAAGWYVDEVRLQATVLPTLGTNVVVEGTPFTKVITSTCPDVQFLLGTNAPSGATIDPVLGIFTWVPDECQGPSTNDIVVMVTHPTNALWVLDSKVMRVVVQEKNEAPQWFAIDPLAIKLGIPLNLRASDYVFDPDCPAQRLTFTLDACSPAGATINPATGVVSWIPTREKASRTNILCLRVTDNDPQQPLSATITVLAMARLQSLETRIADGQLETTWEGGWPDCKCRVLSTLRLPAEAEDWTVEPEVVWPAGDTLTLRHPLGQEPKRFLRLLLSPE